MAVKSKKRMERIFERLYNSTVFGIDKIGDKLLDKLVNDGIDPEDVYEYLSSAIAELEEARNAISGV